MGATSFALAVLVALSSTPRRASDNVDDLVRTTCGGGLGLPDTSECRFCAKLGAPALFACRPMCGEPRHGEAGPDRRDLEHLRCLMECFEHFYGGVAICIEATRSGKDGSKKN